MSEQVESLPQSDDAAPRDHSRRAFFSRGTSLAIGFAGVTMLAACGDDDDPFAGPGCPTTPAPSPTPTATATPTPTPTPGATGTPSTPAYTQVQALNFLLNIAYLKGQFYSFAVRGNALTAAEAGPNAGTVTGGQATNFGTDVNPKKIAVEIANNEIAQIAALRTLIGASAVAAPAINIGIGGTNGFTTFSTNGGIPAGDAVNPYFNSGNFLFGVTLFQDLSVSAFAGAMEYMTDPAARNLVARLMGASAYHAAMARFNLANNTGFSTDANNFQVRNVQGISNARDTLDGSGDTDEGILTTATETNIVPADTNGGIFARSPIRILNILYASRAAADRGAFFPEGVNGDIKAATQTT